MLLIGKRVAILVSRDVEDLEYFVPLMRLREEGAEVLTAAMDMEPLRGKHGLQIVPDARIEDLRPEDLSGVVIPGGWSPDQLRRHAAATDLVRDINAAGKPIGIICHGGLVAISAGIVNGRKATGSVGIRDDLINAGALWVDEAAFRDGNLIWGRVVEDIPAFCRELVAGFAAAGT